MINKFQKLNIYKFKIIILLFFIFTLLPCLTEAAVFYLEPSEGQYQPGDTFLVEVRLDTEGECINVLQATIKFPKDIITVKDFSVGESLITHWIEELNITDIKEMNQKGILSFSGGIPGGYCGRVVGDPGLSNILAKIVFKMPSLLVGNPEEINIVFMEESSSAYLHDGLGTEAEAKFQGAKFEITKITEEQKDEWKEILASDTTAPEPFSIKLEQYQKVLEGKYFIVFWTIDKQTGLDRYEIKEGEYNEFKKASSPYLLEDQTLRSKIWVKAVDKAGNERIVEYLPPEIEYIAPEKEKPILMKKNTLIFVAFLLLIIVISAIVWVWQRKKKKLTIHEEEK